MTSCAVEGCGRRPCGARHKYCSMHRRRAQHLQPLEQPSRRHPNRWQLLLAAVYAWFEADVDDPLAERRVRNRLRMAALRYARGAQIQRTARNP